MRSQFAVQFKTFGQNVATEINTLLARVPCRVVSMHSINVQKIGGIDAEVVVIFERTDQD